MSASVTDARAVEIEGLTVSYRRRGQLLRVIHDLSLHIAPGDAYGLVGESGCGKTTVAMALMRYLPRNSVVESGRIMFGGEDVLKLSEAKLRAWRGERMSMVYQDPGSSLNPSMRVGAQIAEVYRQHRRLGSFDAIEAATAMLERVQISDPQRILPSYPHELSGGQQQRVIIAMALATDPDLLVLDEPTTGLDATVEAEVLDLVEHLRTEFAASILFISHNLGIVARMCERMGVLYAGRLVEEGPSRLILTGPRHPYTVALLRCVPRLGMRKDALRLDSISGSLPPLGTAVKGCVYADRCPIARERCQADPPPLYAVGDMRASRCHYHDEAPSIPPTDAGLPEVAAQSSGEPLLKVEELVKTYKAHGGELTAVAGVSFDVRRGEILGLVGESGCGKTSLAKMVVGLVEPTSGRIELEGLELSARAYRRSDELRGKVRMVFQNPDTALNPRHTIRRILSRSLRRVGGVHTSAERRQRLLELAASVRLERHHLEVRPLALSGGLRQRAAIARAFAGSPRIVLCDEPVSALDVSVQAAILNLLVDLQRKEQVAYLFISHDLAVVRYLADRIAVMYLGWIVDIGPVEAVFNPPHHPYTEALVSAIPTLDVARTQRRVKLTGVLPSPADPPSGCRFHTRCPRFLGAICEEQEPPWQRDEDGHLYRCHISPAELRSVQVEKPPPVSSVAL